MLFELLVVARIASGKLDLYFFSVAKSSFISDFESEITSLISDNLSSVDSLFSLRSVSNSSINFWSSLNTLWVSILISSSETLANSSSGITSSKAYSISYSSSRIIELEGSFIK